MKVEKLIRAKAVIAPLFKEKLSPKLSYKLMKFVSAIEVEEKFYNQRLSQIVDEYADRDEAGNIIPTQTGVRIREGSIESCNTALAELQNTDVDAPDIKFSLDDLSELKFSIEDMVALSDFIMDE